MLVRIQLPQGALQAGCAQQCGSVDPRVATAGGQLYNGLPTSYPEGGAIPGHPLVGRGTSQELGVGDQQSKQVQVAKGLSGRAPPVLAAVALPCLLTPPWTHATLPSPTLPCQLVAKTAGRWGFLPMHQHQCNRAVQFSYYGIVRVEGCRGINGFKLIRRMSGSSC